MALCNLNYSGSTGVIKIRAYVTELTTSGTRRYVRLRLTAQSADGFTGERDGAYSVSCSQSGTDTDVPMYAGFTISGTENTFFDESFYVSIAPGASGASVSLSFSVTLRSPSAGDKTVSGTVTGLTLTAEPESADISPSGIFLSAAYAAQGDTVSITVTRDSSDCWHRLYYQAGSSDRVLLAGNVGTLHSWQVPDLTGYYEGGDTITVTIWCQTYTGTAAYWGQTQATLRFTLPEATRPGCPSSAQLGSKITVSLPRGSEQLTHQVTYSFAGKQGTIASTAGSSCVWEIPLSLASAIPGLTAGQCTLTCQTQAAGQTIGSRTTTLTLTVPDDDRTKPRATMVLTPSAALDAPFTGRYIRKLTGVRAEFTAESDYSEISEYSLTVDGLTVTGNPAVSRPLNGYGTVTVTGRVTDLRGYVRTLTGTISVLFYEKPRVVPPAGESAIIAARCDANGAADPRGRNLLLKAGRSYTPLSIDGVQANFCSLSWRMKKMGDSSYPDYTLLIDPSDTETGEVSVCIADAVPELRSGYTLQLEAADTLGGSSALTIPLAAMSIPLHIGRGSGNVAVGKYCDLSRPDAFEVGLTTYFDTGIAPRKIFGEGSWETGSELSSAAPEADTGALGLYTCFLAVTGGSPQWLLKWQDKITGPTVTIDLPTATLTKSEEAVTALYALL